MARKKSFAGQLIDQAKASWTMLLTYIYILGGIIESQVGFVDKYIDEEWRAPAWIGSMILIGLARMRSIAKNVKVAAKPKDDA